MAAACGMAIGVSIAAIATASPARTRAGTPLDRVGGANINTGLMRAKMAMKTHSGAVSNPVSASAVMIASPNEIYATG